jgi:hypothetical protein
MSKIFTLLVMGVVFVHEALGELASPYQEFVGELLADVDNSWTPDSYVFRFSLDLIGDEEPELLVASSMGVDQSPLKWSVFAENDGEFAMVTKNLELYPNGFYVKREGDGVTLSLARGSHDWVDILQTNFDGRGEVETSIVEYREENAWEILERDEWRETLDLGTSHDEKAVEKVLLAELLLSDTADWKPYYYQAAPEQQRLDPSDKESSAEYSGGFTPEMALKALAKPKVSKVERPTIPETSVLAKSNVPAVVPDKVTEAPSKVAWLLLPLIALAFGVYAFRKKRV